MVASRENGVWLRCRDTDPDKAGDVSLAAILEVGGEMPVQVTQRRLLDMISDLSLTTNMRDKLVHVLEQATRR